MRFPGRVAEWAIYGIVGLMPLAVLRTDRFILWEPPKVAVLNILTLIALAAWFSGRLLSRRLYFRRPPFLLPITAYFAVYAAATVLSLSPVLSIFGIRDRSMGLINLANLILLYFLVFNVLTSRDQQVRCLRILVLSASAVALLGTLQYSGLDPWQLLPPGKGQRIGATLGNADYATPVMLLALPCAIGFIFRRRFLYVASFLLLSAMLLFSLPIPKLTGNWGLGGPSEALTGDESPELVVVAALSRAAAERVEARRGLWEAGVKAALARPLLGTGPNTYRDVFTLYEPLYYVRMLPSYREDKAHNEFIEVAQSTGFLGLGVYLWMLGGILWFFVAWLRRHRKDPDAGFVAAILVALILYIAFTAMLFHTIAAYTWLWVLLGLGAGLCCSSQPVVERRLRLPGPAVAAVGVVAVVALVGLGFTALRPVFAEASFARAQTTRVTNLESRVEATEWYLKAADWHPYEYMYLRLAAHASSSLGVAARGLPLAEGATQESLYYIERATRLEPHNATVYYSRALMYGNAGKKPEEALAEVEKAIELYPYYVMAYNLRADIERSRKNYETAVAARKAALEITPDDADIMMEIGYDTFRAERFSEAIAAIEKAIASGNQTYRARFILGGAYELTQNWEKARESYQAALKIEPGHIRAGIALEGLPGR